MSNALFALDAMLGLAAIQALNVMGRDTYAPIRAAFLLLVAGIALDAWHNLAGFDCSAEWLPLSARLTIQGAILLLMLCDRRGLRRGHRYARQDVL